MAETRNLREEMFEKYHRERKEENRTPLWIWAAIAAVTVIQILAATYLTPYFL